MAESNEQPASQELVKPVSSPTMAEDLAGAASDVVSLRQQVADRDAAVAAGQQALTEAAAKYRDARLASMPSIPPELVKGATVAEVDASVLAAERIVTMVRDHPAERGPMGFVPNQGGGERGLDTSKMTAREKILHGLGRRK